MAAGWQTTNRGQWNSECPGYATQWLHIGASLGDLLTKPLNTCREHKQSIEQEKKRARANKRAEMGLQKTGKGIASG